jgi:hypothetical protein
VNVNVPPVSVPVAIVVLPSLMEIVPVGFAPLPTAGTVAVKVTAGSPAIVGQF